MVTTNRENIATLYAVGVESVAITSCKTYTKHLCIRGRALCGWIDNDGIDIPTDTEEWDSLYCGKCNRHLSKRAK